MAELDLILRKNKEAQNLDVVNFHDIIHRTVKDSDDQILKVLKSFVLSGNSIMNIQPLASDAWGAKEPAYASHYCTVSGILVICR